MQSASGPSFSGPFADILNDVFAAPNPRLIIARQLLDLAQAMTRYAQLLGEKQERDAKKARAA